MRQKFKNLITRWLAEGLNKSLSSWNINYFKINKLI